jgi:hypothetical protein
MATRDKNVDGDNSSIELVFRILDYQQTNNDEPVPGTSYSSHFIDVQLNSMISGDFSADLFTRLLEICTDWNVCRHIWTHYQVLLSKLVSNLDTIQYVGIESEQPPQFTPYFLSLVAKLLYSKVDSENKREY